MEIRKIWAKGLLCDTKEGSFLRVSQILNNCDKEGDRMGGLDCGEHQRRKSIVKDGASCLSISTQLGLADLE